MEKNFTYRLGIDVGIASVGWAALAVNSNDEPEHIIDLGVRTFTRPEVPKTGESLAKARREARTSRRRISRRKYRVQRVKYLLENESVIDVNEFEKKYHQVGLPNVYELRYRALDEEISEENLAQIMLFLAKHRGFKSNRKAQSNEDDGKVLAALKVSNALMIEKGYRTVGEMIYKDPLFHTTCPWDDSVQMLTPRNTSGNYSRTMLRDELIKEVKQIFAKQREFGNKCATTKIEDEYLTILQSQRSFDEGPGPMAGGKRNPYAMDGFGEKVGMCTFEPKEKRAPKAAYSAELFVALEKINHLRIEDLYGNKRAITDEERFAIIDLMYKNKVVKYSQVRKILSLDDKENFCGIRYKTKGELTEEELRKKKEDTKFVQLSFYHELSSIIGANRDNCSDDDLFDLFDPVATTLTNYKSDLFREKELEKLNFTKEQINKLLNLDPSGHINLSCKAVRKIIPYLLKGMTYDKACESAGYNYKAENDSEKLYILKSPEITAQINEITNPVVRRAISQTIKVINAVILRYGSPQAINIELARDMSKSFDERNEIKKLQDENTARNERIRKIIQEDFHIVNPKGQDIIKYRLWEEQNGYCMYSGHTIPAADLFSGAYEVDHILPYSRTFNDSFSNKVLVEAGENQEKGNRIPYEYFGDDDTRWKEYENRVYMIYHNRAKGKRLIKKQLSSEEIWEYKTRSINDTRYIATMISSLVRNYLAFEPFYHPNKKQHVMAVNGTITAYLRKRWGFAAKDRSIDNHHAKDAVIIACVTPGMINKISKYVKAREIRYARNLSFIDEETGEIFKPIDYTRNEWDKMFGTQIPVPWACFKNEVDVRMGADPREFIEQHMDVACELGYSEDLLNCVRPIFVSRMPNHKVTGAAHKETIKSSKYYDSDGIAIAKTNLTNLKLRKNKQGEYEIANYFAPESDKLLYNALLERLIQFNGKAEKAFAEPFYKPKSDGTQGPLVKKVKVMEKITSGVPVLDGNGIASNGEMVRVDVFCENKKYYMVPIYTADVVKKIIPNKACVAHKAMQEWKEMKEENFLFSLYPGDLICVNKKGGIKATDKSKNSLLLKENQFLYYSGMDIATASISGKSHDSAYEFRGMGVQSLITFAKCEVDMLGSISLVKKEKRQLFEG